MYSRKRSEQNNETAHCMKGEHQLDFQRHVQRLVQLTAAPSCLVLEVTRTSNSILCSYNDRMFPTIVVSRLLSLLLLLLVVVVVVIVVVVVDRTMALGSTQSLTEMSTRSISWG